MKPTVIPGPPPRVKPVHRAALINDAGQVSPLCADRPRPIDLKRASWTLRDEDTTCRRCRRRLASWSQA